MGDSTSGPDLFNRLADEFAERYRAGERPAMSEYTKNHPELADQIRELFPALVMIEQFGTAADPATGPLGVRPSGAGPLPERLGDFRILREIARGGMGVVYEAVQESLGRHVALKVLPRRRTADPNHLERFRREARAAAMLHHTNIVPVFGVGEHDGLHYYTMQYIQGQGLDAVLREVQRMRRATDPAPPASPAVDPLTANVALGLVSGQFVGGEGVPIATPTGTVSPAPGPGDGLSGSPSGTGPGPAASATSIPGSSGSPYYRAVARIGVQAAEALAYAHHHRLLHRDVKPANLILDLQGTVWVTDFGLVKAEGSHDLTGPGDLVGTLRYMAPERFRGHADERSDVYALGLTLYEMLVLQPAFPAEERARLIAGILHEDPPRPRELDPRVPRDLETVVLRAMAKDPADRYPSATALAEDLQRFLADRPIAARRPGPLDRAAKWSRRNTGLLRVAGAMALLVLAALVAATAMVWRSNRVLLRTLSSERYASYLQNIALAEREWAANNPRRAEELLAECRQDLRGWEWDYLKRLRSEVIPPLRHECSVDAVAVSPQGDRLAASDVQGGITLWDARTYQRLSHFPAHRGIVWGVAFSPDGKRLASAGVDRDGCVKIWDVASGKLLHALQGSPAASSTGGVAFSPDGRRLAASLDSGIWIWDSATGGLLLSWSMRRRGFVAFSPDGRRLAVVWGEPEVRIWDAATGHEVRRLTGASQPLWCVAFSPDGHWIAAGGGLHGRRKNGEVKIWDASTGREWHTLYGHIELVAGVAFSPDSRRLVSAGQDQVNKVWDVQTGRETLTLRGHRNAVQSIAFSPDGRLFSGGDDRTVLVWDGRTWDEGEGGQEFLTLTGHGETVSGVAFSPDGRLLASADCEGIIKLWPLWMRREPRTIRANVEGVYGVAFSPDGRLLVAVGDDRLLRIWEASTGREIRDLHIADDGVAMSVAFAPDGRSLAVSGWGLDVRILDVATGRQIRKLEGHHGAPNALAFCPDGGRYLVSAGEDGTVRVWDVVVGREVRQLGPTREGRSRGVAFSPDGRLLAACGWDRAVHLWETAGHDPASWRPLPSLPDPTSAIECVAISPDGRLVAWGGTDSTVKVWDGVVRETHTLRGHLSWVRSVAFSHDGRHIASGSQDGTVKIWPVPPSP